MKNIGREVRELKTNKNRGRKRKRSRAEKKNRHSERDEGMKG